MLEIIHYGNLNYRRRYSSCGNLKNDSDSVDISKITCIKCVDRLLHRQLARNRYTSLWENRIKHLREKL
jgi:hypothetical protein